ncbi:MAG: homoserine dehydrogenase [Lentisphaeria bacterium]
MKTINVGILGFGTVGAGVVEALQKNGDLIADRTGVYPQVHKIADLDVTSDRGVDVSPDFLTTDAEAVLNDPKTDVVVELIGGIDVAKKLMLKALAKGKPVVTANKALLAEQGAEIFAAAEESSADVYYEASVAGGIPVIKAMREGLVANCFQEVIGILNGTCNYILTRMEEEDADFNSILQEAQDAGYAEADPGLDVDGLDTAHKTTILASLAYGQWFGMKALPVEGIRDVSLRDIKYAGDLGYRIKLLAIIKQENDEEQMRIHPTLIPKDSLLGSVKSVFNAVWVKGDIVGDTMYYGKGAGREATASAVIADIVDVGLNLKFGSHRRVPAFCEHARFPKVKPMSEIETRYYLRLQVKNHPGGMSRITNILGKLNISIASVTQQEIYGETAPVVLLTYQAREANVQKAVEQLRDLDVVTEEPVLLRIEDLE